MILPLVVLRNLGHSGFCKIMVGKIMVVSAQSETNLDRWDPRDLGLSRPSVERPTPAPFAYLPRFAPSGCLGLRFCSSSHVYS